MSFLLLGKKETKEKLTFTWCAWLFIEFHLSNVTAIYYYYTKDTELDSLHVLTWKGKTKNAWNYTVTLLRKLKRKVSRSRNKRLQYSNQPKYTLILINDNFDFLLYLRSLGLHRERIQWYSSRSFPFQHYNWWWTYLNSLNIERKERDKMERCCSVFSFAMVSNVFHQRERSPVFLICQENTPPDTQLSHINRKLSEQSAHEERH